MQELAVDQPPFWTRNHFDFLFSVFIIDFEPILLAVINFVRIN